MPSFLQLHLNILQLLFRKLIKSSMYVFILLLILCLFVCCFSKIENAKSGISTKTFKQQQCYSSISLHKKSCPVHLHQYPKDLPNQHCETKQLKHSHYVSFKPCFVLSDKMSNASFWQNISLKSVQVSGSCHGSLLLLSLCDIIHCK